MTTPATVHADPERPATPTLDRATARTTGLLYLALAVTGLISFLLVRPLLFVPGDPAATMANTLDHDLLARTAIVLELGIAALQALLALWFFRLFRAVDSFAAACITVLGMVNAIVILVSAAFLATALEVARTPLAAGAADTAGPVQLLHLVSGDLWGVGAVFFGAWLIPMGWCALRSGWMPRPLGWLLIASGVGYVLSAVVGYLAPDLGVLADALTVPATVGEFWILGHLLWRGSTGAATARARTRSS